MKKLLLGGLSVFFALTTQGQTIQGIPNQTYHISGNQSVQINGQIYFKRRTINTMAIAQLSCTVIGEYPTVSYFKVKFINFVSANPGSPSRDPYPALPGGGPRLISAMTFDGPYVNLGKPRGILFTAVKPPSVNHISKISVNCKQLLSK